MTTISGTGNGALAALLGSMASGSGTGSGSSTTTGTDSGTTTGSGLLSSAGLGSGLNVDAIITALVNDRKAGPQGQIAARATQDQNLEAGLNGLSTVLTSLQAALAGIGTSFSGFDAAFSNADVGTVTAAAGAVPGRHDLVVSALATAQKRIGPALDAGAPVGEGTLQIGVGSKSMNIAVSASNTLADIAKAINGAKDNPGVTATVLNGTGGAQLVLSSNATGTANAFTISANATSSSGLLDLANALGTAGQSEAADAQFSIDGVAMSSAGNTVGDALDGVTLDLEATGSTRLTVSRDTAGIQSAVQQFVTAYNAYASTTGQLSSYDTGTGKAGLLLGNATLLSVKRQVSDVLGGAVPGNALGTLAKIGITRNADGSMSLDANAFDAALSSDPASVQDLFSGAGGYATRMGKTIDTFAGANGIIPSQLASLDKDLDALNTQTIALNQRMSVYQAQLSAQYTQLDKLMSQLKNTSSYLTQSLEALNKNNGNNN